MERDVEFDIIPDFETVKLIEKYEVADETEEVEAVRDEISDDVSELKSEKVSLYSKYKIPVVAVILLGVIAVTGFVVKRKK